MSEAAEWLARQDGLDEVDELRTRVQELESENRELKTALEKACRQRDSLRWKAERTGW